MKSLRVFVCILVAVITIFGTFLVPENTFAQATQIPAGGTYDYFSTKAIALFTNGRTQLQKLRDARIATGKDVTQIVANLNAYIDLINEVEKSYNTSFNSGKSAGTAAADVQATALRAALSKYDDILSSPTFPRSASVEADANAIMALVRGNGTVGGIQGLIKEADGIKSGIIKAGSREANALGNADAITRVGEKRESQIKDTCTWVNWSISDCISQAVTWFIKNTLLQIGGFLVWLGANMFNYAVQTGILRFSEWAPETLYPIWIIVRQIVSLVIVFVGLYLGFLYILGDEKGRFEKYIPWVIMFGLFVNFSYPLTRTAIDISNIVSLNIYANTVGNDALTATFTSQNTAGALIMNKLGLQGLVGSAVTEDKSGGLLGAINSVPGALMAVAFVFYAAYIFLMVTGIIVMRMAALVFITIASPLLLVDTLLPVLGEKAQWLRKIFFEQLMVGPVFMIMLALTLKFLDVFKLGLGSVGGIASATGTATTVTTFFNILMMLIMLHIMIKVTRSVAGEFGNYATNAMGKVGGFGLGVATAGTGLLARQSIGRLATKARDSSWVKTNQDSFIGRRVYDMSNAVSKSTFDLRNSKTVAKGAGMAGLSTGFMGVGMGAGSKMTYESTLKAKKDDRQERMSRIKTRYERDVYEKNEKGEDVLVHRKGDVDIKGEQALDRYVASAGGAIFMTKNNKALREELGDKADAEADKRVADAKAKSSEDIQRYNSIKDDPENKDGLGKTRTERRANFLVELEKELATLEKTDPSLRGQKAQALLQSINAIKERRKDDEEAFADQVQEALDKYKAWAGNAAEQEKVLKNLSKRVRDAVTESMGVDIELDAPVPENKNKGSSPNLDTSALDAAGTTLGASNGTPQQRRGPSDPSQTPSPPPGGPQAPNTSAAPPAGSPRGKNESMADFVKRRTRERAEVTRAANENTAQPTTMPAFVTPPPSAVPSNRQVPPDASATPASTVPEAA